MFNKGYADQVEADIHAHRYADRMVNGHIIYDILYAVIYEIVSPWLYLIFVTVP